MSSMQVVMSHESSGHPYCSLRIKADISQLVTSSFAATIITVDHHCALYQRAFRFAYRKHLHDHAQQHRDNWINFPVSSHFCCYCLSSYDALNRSCIIFCVIWSDTVIICCVINPNSTAREADSYAWVVVSNMLDLDGWDWMSAPFLDEW